MPIAGGASTKHTVQVPAHHADNVKDLGKAARMHRLSTFTVSSAIYVSLS